MFKLFGKKRQKDPICGMIANDKFISKHGEKFCSENCLKIYEGKQSTTENKNSDHNHGCGCCG